jgi:uncharacterized membrane protein
MNLNDWKKLALSFVIFGLTGYVIETLVTGTINVFEAMAQPGFTLWGSGQAEHTIWAFFIYCWAGVFMFFTDEKFEKIFPNENYGWLIRPVLYGLSFTAIEFITGAITLYGFGFLSWDYRDHFMNWDGIISLQVTFMWMLAGAFGDYYYSQIRKAQDVWLEIKLNTKVNNK